MGCCLDFDSSGIGQPVARDRLCNSAVRGELSSLYLLVEGTNTDLLDLYPIIHAIMLL